MSKYKIAGLIIDIATDDAYSLALMRDYLYSGTEPADFSVTVTEEMLAYERAHAEPGAEAYCQSIAVLRCICSKVLESYDGFFFHSSCLEFNGKAYIFTAKSGTGKSTHTRLWRECFGGRVTMINDDKPIIRREEGRFYVYGTPWQGKENLGNNIRVPAGAVCVLRQGRDNKIRRINPIEALSFFMDQTQRPRDRKSMEKLLELMDDFLRQTPVYLLDCTVSPKAAETACGTMCNNGQPD